MDGLEYQSRREIVNKVYSKYRFLSFISGLVHLEQRTYILWLLRVEDLELHFMLCMEIVY